MMIRSSIPLRRIACAWSLVLLATPGASATDLKRVLVLDPFGLNIAPYSVTASGFREALVREYGEPVEFYEVSLDLARFAEPEEEASFVEFLSHRFESRPIDLVAPIGTAATQFAAKYRELLFPETPMLVVATAKRGVPPTLKPDNTAFVVHDINLPGMVEDMLQLQPQTTNVVVVFGGSALESYWVEQCRREFQTFTNRVGFTWLNKLSFDQLLTECANLPPQSFILYTLFVVDAAGVPFENHEALRRLHAVARAPIFAYFASDLGLGSVGGRLYQDREVGILAAGAASRILRGEPTENIAPHIVQARAAVYDWRELRRWGISESRLPTGSVIRLRQPSLWQVYRWHIVALILFFLMQTGLIVGLLFNRTTRRRAEAQSRDLSRRLIRAHEEERGRLARELHDDMTQRLARLAIDVGQIERGGEQEAPAEAMRSIRDGLVRLSEDTHALSYRLHPSVLEDLGLVEAVKAECERFSRQESIPVETSLRGHPEPVPLETSLCLFRIAQEALHNVARHAGARTVEVSMHARGHGLHLGICDDGKGFNPAAERQHTSLGLASMRERVALLDGELDIESAPGQGTTVLAWVPLKGEAS